jgi:hypothetical protein
MTVPLYLNISNEVAIFFFSLDNRDESISIKSAQFSN